MRLGFQFKEVGWTHALVSNSIGSIQNKVKE